jgi:hypothetical protein
MVGPLVVGSGRCGRGPDVGVARATSAADGRGHQRDGPATSRTGAGTRCRSTRSAPLVAGAGCGRRLRAPRGRRGRAWPGWPSGTRNASGGPGVGQGRPGPCWSGSAPRWSSAARRPGPAWPVRPGGASSSGRRPAHRWCGCGAPAASVVRRGHRGHQHHRPAVLAWQVGQQPQHERPGAPPWLHPAKPASDPAQQLLQPCLPSGRVYLYAVACGHRLISGCPHNTRSSTVAALVCSPALPPRSRSTAGVLSRVIAR